MAVSFVFIDSLQKELLLTKKIAVLPEAEAKGSK